MELVKKYFMLKVDITIEQLINIGMDFDSLESMKDNNGKLYGYLVNDMDFGIGWKGESFVCQRTGMCLPVYMLMDYPAMPDWVCRVVTTFDGGYVRHHDYFSYEVAVKDATALNKRKNVITAFCEALI